MLPCQSNIFASTKKMLPKWIVGCPVYCVHGRMLQVWEIKKWVCRFQISTILKCHNSIQHAFRFHVLWGKWYAWMQIFWETEKKIVFKQKRICVDVTQVLIMFWVRLNFLIYVVNRKCCVRCMHVATNQLLNYSFVTTWLWRNLLRHLSVANKKLIHHNSV